METTDFGTYLRTARKACGLSQRSLADQAGVDFTYISKIERGRMPPPSEATIRRMAQVLSLEPYVLLNLAGKVPPGLKGAVKSCPEAVELLWVLSEHELAPITYQRMLDLARASLALKRDL